MSGNWDDEDEWEAEGSAAPAKVAPVAGGTGAWDDEDESGGEEDVAAAKPSAPMKPSKARALALKQKEAEEAERERQRVLARDRELAALSDFERKARIQEIVEESDMDNARDLFMEGGKAGVVVPQGDTVDTFKPVTDADYTKYAGMVGDKCCALNDNPRRTMRYVAFVKDLMRAVTKDLGPDDVKDLASHMGVISNEKRDEFKKSKGFKKKTSKKTTLRVDRAGDMRDDSFADFDGDVFM